MKRFLVTRADSSITMEIYADRYDIIDGTYQFYANESVIYSAPYNMVSECVLDNVNTSQYTLLKS